MNATITAALYATCLVSLAASTTQAQQPAPFANADPQQGRALVDKDCHGCHERLFGDQDRIYTRADRRVKTPAQLRAQIAYCNTQLGTGYFPEDEEHIAAWLNQRYYHFNP
jgi:cytochrome c2